MEKQDFVLCECELVPLEKFVASLEPNFELKIVKSPAISMVMVQAEDSVEFQEFYLGEALVTECELLVNGQRGLGICLGDEPVRCYCIAFIDAITQLPGVNLENVNAFLNEQYNLIMKAEQLEYNQVLRTRVDFKLMEQE